MSEWIDVEEKLPGNHSVLLFWARTGLTKEGRLEPKSGGGVKHVISDGTEVADPPDYWRYISYDRKRMPSGWVEFRRLRQLAGHTQKEAARYIYSSERTIREIEAGKEDLMRTELYRYKLIVERGVGEGK